MRFAVVCAVLSYPMVIGSKLRIVDITRKERSVCINSRVIARIADVIAESLYNLGIRTLAGSRFGIVVFKVVPNRICKITRVFVKFFNNKLSLAKSRGSRCRVSVKINAYIYTRRSRARDIRRPLTVVSQRSRGVGHAETEPDYCKIDAALFEFCPVYRTLMVRNIDAPCGRRIIRNAYSCADGNRAAGSGYGGFAFRHARYNSVRNGCDRSVRRRPRNRAAAASCGQRYRSALVDCGIALVYRYGCRGRLCYRYGAGGAFAARGRSKNSRADAVCGYDTVINRGNSSV